MRDCNGRFVTGNVVPEEIRVKISHKLLGIKRLPITEEHRKNLRISHIGIPNSTKGIPRPGKRGKNHPRWMGGAKRPEYTRVYSKEYRHSTGFSKKFNYRTTGIRPKIVMSGKEYSENWHEIRKTIYRRDDWDCQECGCECVEKEHKDTKRKICCHHIDYNETNNGPRNLITLCASCHGKTNFNRPYWTEHFINKTKDFSNMLDIMDKNGKVVAVLLDDGTVVKKQKTTDDIEKMVKDAVSKALKERE